MKRARRGSQGGRSGPVVVQTQGRRPIDKQIIVVAKQVTNTQGATELYTVTFPGTMVGLRWDFSHIATTTAPARIWWAIVVVKDGLSASTMTTSDAGSFYQPESNCVAFGASYVTGNAQGNALAHEHGSTKAMRKLQNGDKLVAVYVSDIVNGTGLSGICQFFIKS